MGIGSIVWECGGYEYDKVWNAEARIGGGVESGAGVGAGVGVGAGAGVGAGVEQEQEQEQEWEKGAEVSSSEARVACLQIKSLLFKKLIVKMFFLFHKY